MQNVCAIVESKSIENVHRQFFNIIMMEETSWIGSFIFRDVKGHN